MNSVSSSRLLHTNLTHTIQSIPDFGKHWPPCIPPITVIPFFCHPYHDPSSRFWYSTITIISFHWFFHWLYHDSNAVTSTYQLSYCLFLSSLLHSFFFFFCIQCVCCSSENLAQWVCSQPFFFLFAELTVISAVLGALSRHPKKLQFFKINGLCSFRFKIWTAITLKFSLS